MVTLTPAPVRSYSATKRAKTFTTLLKLTGREFAICKNIFGNLYKYGSVIPENGLDCVL
jgi:hypothetical protein